MTANPELSLPASSQILFFLRVAYELTVAARDPSPSGDLDQYRRGCNELIHRITSWCIDALGPDGARFTASDLVDTLEGLSRAWGIERIFLWAWRVAKGG